MSTGYKEMREDDFYRYFSGSLMFHYTPATGEVAAWSVQHPSGEPDYGELAVNCSCRLYSGKPIQERDVSIDTLFNSHAWMVHRWPVQYITPSDGLLLTIEVEPEGRRMTKGINRDYLRVRGCMHVENLAGADLKSNFRLESDYSAYHDKVHSSWAIESALTKVLSYGHHPHFAKVRDKWARDSGSDISTALNDKERGAVIVPESYTAFIKLGGESRAFVLHHGAIIGELVYDKDRLVLTSDHPSTYDDPLEQALVADGIRAMATRLCKVNDNNCEVNLA